MRGDNGGGDMCQALPSRQWQRGTSTALARGTWGPSMRCRGMVARSCEMRSRSARLSSAPMYAAACDQGRTLVHIKAQLEHEGDTCMG